MVVLLVNNSVVVDVVPVVVVDTVIGKVGLGVRRVVVRGLMVVLFEGRF